MLGVRHTLMPQEWTECPLFTPEAGDRIRVLIEYGGSWRPIFWFQVSRDGSVYLGPRYVDITQLLYGAASRVEDGFRVSYGNGAAITDPEVRKRAKLLLHASGVINTPAGRATRPSLRSLSEQQLLCSALFQHPGAFDVVDIAAIKRRDVCLRYPIEEARPLWCHLYVAPGMNNQVVKPASAVFQLNALFKYAALDGVPDLVLQLVFGHGAAGPWPPHSYLVFAATGPLEGQRGA
jgi:hypothetical protein